MIGPPIETKGAEPRAVNERVQRWIEDTLVDLAPDGARFASAGASDVEVGDR